MLVFSGFSFRRNCHVAVAVRAIAGQHGVIGMRGDVRCRNWKQATSFMDVRDRLPNGPSGPLSQLLGCSPNINEPFLTRDNGSLRTRINFISVGVLDGANSIWGAIYLLAGILNLRQKGCRRYLRGFARAQDLLRYVSSFIMQLFGRAAVKRKGSFFHIFFYSSTDTHAVFLAVSLLVKSSLELYQCTQWSAEVKCYCCCLSHTPFNPQHMFLVSLKKKMFECFVHLNVMVDF